MKYNININQKGLENDKDITLIEASVIDWIYTFCGTNNRKINKQKVDGFTWINCQYLIDDMPLLRIKSRSGGARLLTRLEGLGYIEIKREPRKLLIKTTDKMDSLYVSQSIQVVDSKEDVGACEQPSRCLEDTNHNTNILILDTNTITLPEGRGKTPSQRLMSIYKDCFKFFYGFDYKPNFGRDLKILKDLTESYSELQIARMLTIFFNWHGMTGSNDSEFNFLSGASFNLGLFKVNVTKYEVYSRNILNEAFDDDEKLLTIVGKHILNLKS